MQINSLNPNNMNRLTILAAGAMLLASQTPDIMADGQNPVLHPPDPKN